MSADVKPFQCQLCGQKFTISNFLETHMKSEHVEGGEFECGECCCVFAQPDKLNEHQVLRHDYIPNAKIRPMVKVQVKKDEGPKEKSLKCKFCGITFHNFNFLKSHQKRKHGYESEESEEESEEDDDEEETIDCNGRDVQQDEDKNLVAQKRESPRTNGSKISPIGKLLPEEDEEEEEIVHSNKNFRDESHENLSKTRTRSSFKDDAVEILENVDKDTSLEHGSTMNHVDDPYDDDGGLASPVQNFEESPDDDYQNSFQLPMPTDFLVQNDYDVEPEEAQIRRANIEQLINSIPEDDEEETVQSCELCGNMYADLQSLLAHKKKNHVKGGHKCQYCSCVFATSSELVVHNGIFHNTAPPLVTGTFNSTTAEKLFLTCDYCGLHFDDELKLTIHKLENHVSGGHACPSCPSSFMSTQELAKHQQSSHVPSGMYASSSSQRGKRKTSNSSPHNLYTSQRETPRESSDNLRTPRQVMTGIKKEFFCQICNVPFPTYSSCTTHLNTCHVPGGKFACPDCPCNFKNKSSLNSHRKRHSREALTMASSHQYKPASSNVDAMQIYSCEICSVNFLNMVDYLGHKQESHVENGQYPCGSCPCVFQTSDHLKTHRVVFHNNLTITSVPSSSNSSSSTTITPRPSVKSFVQGDVDPASIDIALVQPNSQGKFNCPLCQCAVANRASLKGHLQKSHLPKGYRCKVCACVLASLAGIKNHLNQYHRHIPNSTDQYVSPYDVDDFQHPLPNSSSSRKHTSSSSSYNKVHDVEDEEFKCAECDWTLSDATDLQNHKIQFHGFKPKSNFVPSAVDEIINNDDPFSCSACHRTFKRKSETISHRKRNHVLGGHKCPVCPYSFKSAKELSNHKNLRHPQHKKKVVKKPPPGLIPIENKQNNTVEHVCILCGRKYQLYASLCAHKHRSHKPSGKASCTHCTCVFNGFTDLDMHFKKYHRHVKFAPDQETFDASKRGRGRPKKNQSAISSILRFSCQYYKCGASCKNQSSLTTHIRKHLGPIEVVTLEPDNGFKCEECNIEFETKRDFASHRNSVHDYDIIQRAIDNPTMTASGKYECRFCSTLFARCSAMVAHVKTFHIEETRLICFECPDSEEFATLSDLKLHRARLHGMESNSETESNSTPVIVSYASLSGYEKPKQPQCELCGRIFLHHRSLWAHRKRSHVPAGQFPCSLCCSNFGTSRGLRNHQLIFHGIRDDSSMNKDNQENPWLIDCEDCDVTFTSCRKYEAHQKRFHAFEGPYPCDDCSCCFLTSTSLNIHRIKMHELELPEYVPKPIPIEEEEEEEEPPVSDSKSARYSCSSCHLTFGFLRFLINHKKLRHGIEDKRCIICKKDFPSTDSLVEHAVNSHDSNESKQTTIPTPSYSSSVHEYPCHLCGMILSLPSSLQVHMEVSHVKNGQYACPLCPCIFGTPASLSSHKLGHNLRKKVQTGTNNMIMKDLIGETKKRTRTSTNPGTAVAKKKTSYPPRSSRSADIVGIAFSAAMGSDSQAKKSSRETDSKKRTRSKMLECKQCDRKFTLAITLQDHMKRKHGEGSESPNKAYVEQIDLDSDGGEDYFCTKKSRKEPTPPPPPPKKRKTKFPCKECNIVYPKLRILRTHKLVAHAPGGTLKCDKCTCTFSLAWGLFFHKKYQHVEKKSKPLVKKKKNKTPSSPTKKNEKKGKKRRKAKEKGFFSPRTLRSRERLISWTESMHPCKVCGMKFRLTSQLARHERINHPGRPEYLCEKCPSMTALSKELIYHEEIYHSHFKNMHEVLAKRRLKRITTTNNSTPAPAIQAPQTLKPKPIMNFIPLKLDENLPLDLSNVIASYSCGSEFTGQSGLRLKDSILRRKLRRRKGIFMCRVCRMMFLKKRSLSWHLKIHVGEKPFKCRFCSVTFRTYGDLCFHKRKHLAIRSGEKEEVIERNPLGRCSYCKTTFRTSLLADIHFDEVHPELKFLDMCQEASNLWKEIQSAEK